MTEPGKYEGDKGAEFESLLAEARGIIESIRPDIESLIKNTDRVYKLIEINDPSSADFFEIISEANNYNSLFGLAVESLESIEKYYKQKEDLVDDDLTCEITELISDLKKYSSRIKACSQRLAQILEQDQS